VVQFFSAGRLEGENRASLRVHTGHDVLDHPILAGSVQTLEDDQDCPAVLRVEFLLQVVEHAFACIEYVLRVLLAFDPGCVSGSQSFRRNSPPLLHKKVLQGARPVL